MVMKKFNVIVITISILFISSNSFANANYWGKTGHRTVGQIAQKYLTKRAKREINKLLDGHSLAFVSTYADEIKADKRFNKYYTWHFVDYPFGVSYKDSKKNPKGDLVTGIKKCVSVLKDKDATKADKEFYLKLLVHFIGDLHQPLHVGLATDRGGNDIHVEWFNKKTNLHSVWDSKMIDYYKMSYTELASNAEQLSQAQIKAIQKGTVMDWIRDSRKVARKVYASAKPGDNLRYKYMYNYFGIVQFQLEKGGLRLAKLLNAIFK